MTYSSLTAGDDGNLAAKPFNVNENEITFIPFRVPSGIDETPTICAIAILCTIPHRKHVAIDSPCEAVQRAYHTQTIRLLQHIVRTMELDEKEEMDWDNCILTCEQLDTRHAGDSATVVLHAISRLMARMEMSAIILDEKQIKVIQQGQFEESAASRTLSWH